jgi:hypothetical protein
MRYQLCGARARSGRRRYPRSNEVLAHAPALPGDVLYPKERTLVDLVRRERGRGRRVLVYATHTNLLRLARPARHADRHG